MGEEFGGGRISSRIELYPDGNLEGFWRINGKDENLAAMGQPGDISRLALMILEGMGDRRDELPALDWSSIPSEVVELVEMYRNDPGQKATMGGILMAAGIRMLREAREDALKRGMTEDGRVEFGMHLTELPFRLEIQP